MFEINKYLLNKMGWLDYSVNRGLGTIGDTLDQPPFSNDSLVRFFIDIKDHYICYIIKEFSKSEKQKNKNPYKFIKMDYNQDVLIDGKPKFEIIGFDSNQKLFELVINNKACNSEYKRHFLINNILK